MNVDTGALVGVAKQDIKMWNPAMDLYEQSSEDIWAAVCSSVRGAMAEAGVTPSQVCGIGFDATCSLVCLDSANEPVGIDPGAPNAQERNVIVWLDHRAEAQAARINRLDHERLETVGGTISPEMELPKLLWLKEELPEVFACVDGGGKFLDLVDFLSYKASDFKHDVRSLCTVVCKWNYDEALDGSGIGWDREFFTEVGFDDDELSVQTIGSDVRAPGEPIPGGLGEEAATELGLERGCALAVGMIDAHAGGVGCLGAPLPGEHEGAGVVGGVQKVARLEERLALICGTSSCHMASSIEPVFVPGVWGPYTSAMFEGLHLNEGGQSAAGKLLDFLIQRHAAYPKLREAAEAASRPPSALLNERAEVIATATGAPSVAFLTSAFHMTPDFVGNRSPLADPSMRGAIVGLGLADGLDELALLYLAAVQALAYQTRQIIDAMELSGHPPMKALVACGGLTRNELFVQTHADAIGRPIYLPRENEAVLLGASVLGATAGRAHASVAEAMEAMTAIGKVVSPTEDAELNTYHERKYEVFRRMVEDQLDYQRMMQVHNT